MIENKRSHKKVIFILEQITIKKISKNLNKFRKKIIFLIAKKNGNEIHQFL